MVCRFASDEMSPNSDRLWPMVSPVRETKRRTPLSRPVSAAGPDMKDISGLRLLISDEHYKHSLAIVRHLGRRGVQVSIVATSAKSLACRSKYCHKVIPSRAEGLEALVETILESVKRERFDLVMPVSYPLTLALARRRDEFAKFTRLEVVEGEAIELAANKAKMTDLAAKIGVPAPKTLFATEIEDRAHELRFPVVIKPQKESPGRAPIRYADNLVQLRKHLSAGGHQGIASPGDGLLVQEFIPGFGCGFFATYQKGVCKRIFMHRRVREYPASGGVSSCAESFYDPQLEMHGRRMLDSLDWHGVAMVEFRHDSRDNQYKLMEINPKFWGSLDLALAAGADFPGDLCQMALGSTLTFTGDYHRKLRFQWPFSGHGDLFHLWTRPQSILQVGVDFLNPRVKSNFWLSDPGPNKLELQSLAGKLLNRLER